jgi:hypothetical protein
MTRPRVSTASLILDLGIEFEPEAIQKLVDLKADGLLPKSIKRVYPRKKQLQIRGGVLDVVRAISAVYCAVTGLD